MKAESAVQQIFTSLFYTLLFCVICLLSGCGYALTLNNAKNLSNNSPPASDNTNSAKNDDDKKKSDAILEQNRRLWSDKKILNYDFTASLVTGGFSYPADPVRIRVRDQKIASIERLTGNDRRETFFYDEWAPVDKMFDKILDESARGRDVSVKYNKEYGYPEHVGIIITGTTYWVDFEIKSFEIKEPQISDK